MLNEEKPFTISLENVFWRWNLFDKAAAVCLDLTMTMKDGIFMGNLLKYLSSLHEKYAPNVYIRIKIFIVTTC